MIEPTDEMREAFERAGGAAALAGEDSIRAGLAAVLAIVERDWCMERRGHVYHPLAPRATCPATVDTRGTIVRCGKPADGHDTHLGRHCGWDVVW